MPVFSRDQLFEALTLSQEFGFLSPQSIDVQIEHSLDFLSLIPLASPVLRIIDLGAGGGLPSLVWLYADPSVSITAIDAMNKRTEFLESTAKRYGIEHRLTVLNGRAEEIGRIPEMRESTDLVVARGFGPPATTAECASSLLRVGGKLVVSGRPVGEKKRWSAEGLKTIGCELQAVINGKLSHACIINKTSPLDERYPRRASAMKKSPLWSVVE